MAARRNRCRQPAGADILLPISHDSQEFTDRALPAALAKATEHHRAGELVQAEQIYREVLYHLPRNIDAQRLLGMLARQTGRVQLAINSLRRALAAGDPAIDTRICLAASLRDADKLDESLALYRRWSASRPIPPKSRLGLAKTLIRLYRPDEARIHLEEAIRLVPDFAEAHLALAGILADDGEQAAGIDGMRSSAGGESRLRAGPRPARRMAGSARANASGNRRARRGTGDPAGAGRLAAVSGRAVETTGTFSRSRAGLPPGASESSRPTRCMLNDLGLVLTDQGCLVEGLNAYEAALNVESGFSAAAFQSIVGLVAARPTGRGLARVSLAVEMPGFPLPRLFSPAVMGRIIARGTDNPRSRRTGNRRRNHVRQLLARGRRACATSCRRL